MKKKKNGKSSAWTAVLCVALAVCILCVGFAGWYMYRRYEAERKYEELRARMEETETETERAKYTLEEIQAVPFNGWNDGDAPVIPENVKTELADNPIDFDMLADINPDIYAWIEIPDTQIDYPVAQSAEDDSFYLHHNMYQEPEFAGCIYTEMVNSKDFSDPMTVMYGHNMRNGSMFQNLHLFAEPEFFEEHPYFYVYTPTHKLTYEVFAAYEYNDNHLLNSFDFSDDKVFEEYLEDVQKGVAMGQQIRTEQRVTKEDKVLTLSTCMGDQTSSRFLVQAVLKKNEKTK